MSLESVFVKPSREQKQVSSLFTLARRNNPKRLEKFLLRFVNAMTATELEALEKAFGDLMPKHEGGLIPMIFIPGLERGFIDPRNVDDDDLHICVETPVDFVNGMKIVWYCSDRLLREIFIVTTLACYFAGCGDSDEEQRGFPVDGFTLALLHALRLADNMRTCGNPDCKAPYYLSARGKYCSKECAAPSQRAFKLAWWKKHKAEQLRKRRRLRARSKYSQKKG